MQSRTYLNPSRLIALLMLVLFGGLTSQLAADARQPPDAPAQQSQALAFVEVEEEALPEDVVKVVISRFSYQPAEITIESGTTVLWVNEDPAGHNAAFIAENISDLEQDMAGPIVGQGERFAVRFDKAGRYDYYCTPHPFMKGVVIVE